MDTPSQTLIVYYEEHETGDQQLRLARRSKFKGGTLLLISERALDIYAVPARWAYTTNYSRRITTDLYHAHHPGIWMTSPLLPPSHSRF